MRNFYILIVFILCFSGCTRTSNSNIDETDNTVTEQNDLSNVMPDVMPENFEIAFEYGVEQAEQHDSINTIDNVITKDLVIDGLAHSELNIGHDQLEQIYNELAKINVIKYPNNFTPPYQDNPEPDVNVLCTPSMEYKLNIQYSDVDYELYWHNDNCSKAEQAVTLGRCFNNIIRIIFYLDSYKSLPEVNGGYD